MLSHRPRMAAERPNFNADSQRFSYDSQLANAVEREQEYWQHSHGAQ